MENDTNLQSSVTRMNISDNLSEEKQTEVTVDFIGDHGENVVSGKGQDEEHVFPGTSASTSVSVSAGKSFTSPGSSEAAETDIAKGSTKITEIKTILPVHCEKRAKIEELNKMLRSDSEEEELLEQPFSSLVDQLEHDPTVLNEPGYRDPFGPEILEKLGNAGLDVAAFRKSLVLLIADSCTRNTLRYRNASFRAGFDFRKLMDTSAPRPSLEQVRIILTELGYDVTDAALESFARRIGVST